MTLNALDDKGALRYRLALGAATATTAASSNKRGPGGRGTLTRSAQNLLLGDLLRIPASKNSEDRRDAARELRLLQIEMNKMALVLNRIRRETQQLGDDAERESGNNGQEGSAGGGRDVKALSERVREMRHQVRTAQQAQACQAEYEALASLLHRRHAVPQSVLRAQVDAIDRQMAAATRELQHKKGALQVRTAQVSALIQSILDLKQSLLLASEGGETLDVPLAASTPSSSAEASRTDSRSLGSSLLERAASSNTGKLQAKKRRRIDSSGDEVAAAESSSATGAAAKRTDATMLDEQDGMEEGEESNDNPARLDDADERKGNDGQEEELYGDL